MVPEYDDYALKHNWTKRVVDIKLNHTAEVICDLNADILGLQESPQNEVIKGISGIYKDTFFQMNGGKIPIYFKKKKLLPPNGSRLKIHYAHLGYYKKLQIVIDTKKDFEIMR